jgi:hypothetical protein
VRRRYLWGVDAVGLTEEQARSLVQTAAKLYGLRGTPVDPRYRFSVVLSGEAIMAVRRALRALPAAWRAHRLDLAAEEFRRFGATFRRRISQ